MKRKELSLTKRKERSLPRRAKKSARAICLTLSLMMTLTFALLCLACSCSGSAEETDYVFVNQGVTLQAGALVGTTMEKLGDPKDYRESGSCGGIAGLDRVYAYNGFTVYTTPGTEGDVIAKIELTDDSVATPEGLKIGSDKKAVTDALGVGEAVGSTLVYTGKGVKLTFVLRDDVVTNIQYTSRE